MLWDRSAWNKESLAFYKRLIALRKTENTLFEGAFEVLYWDVQLVCYQRELAGKKVLVTLNRGPEQWMGQTVSLPAGITTAENTYQGYFSGYSLKLENGQLILPDLPKGGEVWLSAL